MAQTKKEDVRDAILEAAFDLFSAQGYSETSIPGIARRAGFSTANVYVYFNSKIEIFFTLYEPWLLARLNNYEKSIRRIRDPRKRMERVLLSLWRDLPRESNGFANNLLQAVSTSAGNGDYSPRLRELVQERVTRWIAGCIEGDTADASALASVVLMAFDGFAMNVRLAHGVDCDRSIVKLLSGLVVKGASPSVEPATQMRKLP